MVLAFYSQEKLTDKGIINVVLIKLRYKKTKNLFKIHLNYSISCIDMAV